MSENGTNDSEASKRAAPLKPPHRRLVVMFDGTGNTRQSLTNVSRMFEAIDDSHPESYKCIGGSEAKSSSLFRGPACTKIVPCETCNESRLERAEHAGDDSEANFRAGVPCGSCHQRVMEPELEAVQLVKYIGGVKTDRIWLIRFLSAQAHFYGLSDKIKEGYTWLCDNYEEGDEVFVFGFSLGAFAARNLVSLLHRCDGVLKKTRKSKAPDDVHMSIDDKKSRAPDDLHMSFGDKTGSTVDDKEAIETAYNYYRACVESPDKANEANLNGVKLKLAKLKQTFLGYFWKQKISLEDYIKNWNNSTAHEYDITKLSDVPVKMLGVWDTVGVLGVAETVISTFDKLSWSRAKYLFLDEGLSCIVQNAYHALALDEQRKAFKPTLWTSQGPQNQEVKQVWFVGNHSNVGGGADLDDNDDPDDLWLYSYVWMQRQAEKHGLRFFWNYESPATRQRNSDNSHSHTRRVSLQETGNNKCKHATSSWQAWCCAPPVVREFDPKLAMLHWSVLDRLSVTEKELIDLKKLHPVKQMSEVYGPPALFPNGRPNDSTKLVAIPANWHIETDDVWTSRQWALPKVEEKCEQNDDKKVK